MKPLSDEEVPGWLRDGELDLWRYWVVENVRPNGNVPNALRSLAETRRALAEVCDDQRGGSLDVYDGGCSACIEAAGHRPPKRDFICPRHRMYALVDAMPRPGRPEVRG